MRRQHKDHTALRAQERGSVEWKERLRKRALNRVEQIREEARRKHHNNNNNNNNGNHHHDNQYQHHGGYVMSRGEMHRIITDEWDRMDMNEDDTTLSGDLPPLTDQDYEDLMLAMYSHRGPEQHPIRTSKRSLQAGSQKVCLLRSRPG